MADGLNEIYVVIFENGQQDYWGFPNDDVEARKYGESKIVPEFEALGFSWDKQFWHLGDNREYLRFKVPQAENKILKEYIDFNEPTGEWILTIPSVGYEEFFNSEEEARREAESIMTQYPQCKDAKVRMASEQDLQNSYRKGERSNNPIYW